MRRTELIAAEGLSFSRDTYKTGLNNNVVIVGSSGSGKTRGVVIPNLLSSSDESFIISDPKGKLYTDYGKLFKKRGYKVKLVDFTDPSRSNHYNPFQYIKTTQDISKLSHMIVYAGKKNTERHIDPYWDDASELVIQAGLSALLERGLKSDINFRGLIEFLDACRVNADDEEAETVADSIIKNLEDKDPDSFAVRQYKKFRVGSSRTLLNVLNTASASLFNYDTKELEQMTSCDDMDFHSVGKEKTALFVIVSDTDRSMDMLANLFFTQAMNELCSYADKSCENQCLPIPVRFIMDDFATNVSVDDFPRIISCIRSRNIETTIILQSESQLTHMYGPDSKTIITNCDTYIYTGGTDVETARTIAERTDLPLKKILAMPIEACWVFRRGSEPIQGKIIDLDQYLEKEVDLNEKNMDAIH